MPYTEFPGQLVWGSTAASIVFTAIAIDDGVAQIASIQTSVDGINWVLQSTPFPAGTIGGRTVTYAPGLGLWVVTCENDGINQNIASSPDGVVWTKHTTSTKEGWSQVAWSPGLAIFTGLSPSGTTNHGFSSTDGLTFTNRNLANGNVIDTLGPAVAWSPSLALFVNVSNTATNGAQSSTDGLAWTSRTGITGCGACVAWSPALAIFAACGSTNCMSSTTGTSWTVRTKANACTSVAWSPSLAKFCAIGNNVGQTSTNGTSWTAIASPPTGGFTSICWSATKSLFVATGGGALATSPDAVTWTARTPANGNTYVAVACTG